MVSGVSAFEVLAEIASQQWGLVTTAQALPQSISKVTVSRLAQRGLLEPIARGLYAIPGSDSLNRDIHAAWVLHNPALQPHERAGRSGDAVVSHESAARIHELGDYFPESPELTSPTRKRSRHGVVYYTGTLEKSDVSMVGGLPVTTPERTVVDLLRTDHDREHVSQVLRTLHSRGTYSRGKLRDAFVRANYPDVEETIEALEGMAGVDVRTLSLRSLDQIRETILSGQAFSQSALAATSLSGLKVSDLLAAADGRTSPLGGAIKAAQEVLKTSTAPIKSGLGEALSGSALQALAQLDPKSARGLLSQAIDDARRKSEDSDGGLYGPTVSPLQPKTLEADDFEQGE